MSWDEAMTERVQRSSQLRRDARRSLLARHRCTFEVTAGPDEGLRWEIDRATARLGTAPTCEVRLTDDTVSRHHCEVAVRDDRYVLRDLGSTNGTRVDGVWVVEAYLEPGSRVTVGESQIVFEGERTWQDVPTSEADHLGELYGRSASMRSLFGILERVAPTTLSVLVLGETGTGKDLAARAIHEASARASGPFVVVDCGALNPNLVESQLFGHERGAFTGADRARQGAFERADGGTVFLDEIGELPLDLQPRLLRVLERREVERLGGSDPVDVDVRVLGATHRDLAREVEAGRFRDDLFYRLAEVVVELPPLRERKDDIALIARRLLAVAGGPRRERTLDPRAVSYLEAQDWPGNVRELRNTIRRAAALAPGERVGLELLRSLEHVSPRRSAPAPATSAGAAEVRADLPIKPARDQWSEVHERRYLEEVMARVAGDIGAAAAHMQIHRKSVYRLLRQHGLLEDD